MTLERVQETNVRLTRRIALVGLMGMLIIATATLIDVLSRWLLSAPIAGVYDLSTLFISVALAACFPAALASRQNIRVMFLADLMPPKVDQTLDVISDLITLTFFALLAWQLAVYCGELVESGETSFILEVPIAPWWIAVTALFFLCIPVQGLVVVVDVMRLFSASSTRSEGQA